jgi:hypothetical protein
MVLLILWAILAAGCFAYGLFFYKILLRWRLIDDSDPVKGSDLVLVGLCLLVLFVQLASIFLPTNYYLALFWLAGAVLLAILSPTAVSTYIRRFTRQQKQIPLFWLLVVVVALYSTLEGVNPDSGFYHLPSIRWYERFRAIPGLGNLHGRLAFNSSFLVASAAFGFTDLAGQTLFPFNGFLFLVVGWRLMGQIRSATPYRFLALTMLILVFYYLTRQVFSPTPDIWSSLLPITIFMIWLEIRPVFSIRHILLFLLVCLSITVKLATIPIALSLLPVGWAVRQQLSVRHFLWLGSLGALMVVPWLIRNAILSGYLIYPFPGIDLFSFDWKIPIERVRYEKDFVEFWAKFHLYEPFLKESYLKKPLLEWFPEWWRFKPYYPLNKPTWLLAVLSPAIVFSHFLQPIRRERFRPILLPYLVALLGFLFWFFSAPEFRFGYPSVWMTAFLPLLPFIPRKTAFWNLIPWSNATILTLLSILLATYVYTFLWKEHFPIKQYALMPKSLSFTHVGPEAEVFDRCPTQSGLEILIPQHGLLILSCFEQELPCSPNFYPDLELRGATVADGFRSSLQSHR